MQDKEKTLKGLFIMNKGRLKYLQAVSMENKG